MMTNLKRKMSKKVLCVMLALLTVLSGTDFTVLAAEGRAEIEATTAENSEDDVAMKEEKSESDTAEDATSGLGETGGEDSEEGEQLDNQTKSPANSENNENLGVPGNQDASNSEDDDMPSSEAENPSKELDETVGVEESQETIENVPLALSTGWQNWYYGDGWGFNGYVSWCVSDTILYIDMTEADIVMPSVANYYNIPWYTYLNQIKSILFVDSQTETTIASKAFYGSMVESFDFQRENSMTLFESCFANCQSLTNVSLDAPQIWLNLSAFENCENLKYIDLNNCIYLDLSAKCFKNCNSLETINLADKEIEAIYYDTFCGCSSLKSIYLSNELNSIEENAFFGCNSLKDVYFDGTKEEWNSISIYSGNDSLEMATIHCNDDGFEKEEVVKSLDNPLYDSSGNTTWNCIWFGHYWQEDTDENGRADWNDDKQPIKWRILSKSGNDLFLMSDKILDCKSFGNVPWGESSLREWLNSDFYQSAFSSEEQSKIKESIVDNSANAIFDTAGSEDTVDKIYIPSVSEIISEDYGFKCEISSIQYGGVSNAISRMGIGTMFAHYQGLSYITDDNSSTWLLRSTNVGSDYTRGIDRGGELSRGGPNVLYSTKEGIRPVLHLDILGGNWDYAGTVCSDGTTKEIIPNKFNEPINADIEISGNANIFIMDADLGTSVAGAVVNEKTADVNGYVSIPVDEGAQETLIVVTADGYNAFASMKKLEPNGTYYISLTPTDGEFAIVYAKATIGSTATNLLTDKIYLQHTSENVSGSADKTTLDLEVRARGDVTNYTLIQDGIPIDSNAEGKFSLPILPKDSSNSLTSLAAQKSVSIKATNVNGDTTIKRIGIYISPEGATDIKEENKSGSFSIGSEISATLPDDIPFLGGGSVSYGLKNPLPFEMTVERNGQVKIAINKDTSESMDAFKEDYDKLSERAKNLSDAAAAFGGTPQSFGGGYFSAKVTAKGYGEGYIDMTKPGTVGIKVEVILSGKGNGGYTQYFMAGSVPIYVSVEAGAEVSGAATLSVNCEDFVLQTEGGVGTLSGKIYLTAAAGVGVKKVISVGVSGTGACNYTWKPKDDYTKVWLNAYLELEADCFGWHMNIWKSPEATYTIYESKDPSGGEMGGRALTESMITQLYNADAYTVMDRSYLNQESGSTLTAFSIDGSNTFVQSFVYPGADPKLVRAADKFYLFWLQDIPSRSAENRAAVVYAYSDDGANFTAPKQLVPESENQTHDNGIDVCVDGGKIYVCWQDAAKTFASGSDLNEVAGNQYISYAVVDASTGEVLSHETVTETAGCYLQPQIYANQGEAQIAWIQNSMTSADGLWGTDNQESLQKYDATTRKLETFPIGEGSEKIVSMDGAVGTSQAGVVYALDTDGNLQTVSDRVIYFDSRLGSGGSQTLLTAEAGMNDNPVAEGGRIFWYTDGNISYTTVGSTAVQQIYEEARPDINSNFQVLSEGERTEIIWDAIEYETEKVALYGISSTGEGWTSPYVIEQTDSEMTGTLTGSLRGGVPYIAYMHIRNQEDGSKSSSLCVTQKKDVTDLALTYAGYEYEDFKQGQTLPISVELINRGNTTVETVEMKMDGVSLGTQDIHLDAGETGNFILEQYTVPAEMDSYGEHTLTVTADGESVISDNDYQIGIGYTDMKVLCSQRWQDEATWLDLSVLNDSDIASDVTLNIRGDKEDGEILYSEELGEIAGGKGISMTVNLQPYEDSCCTYFVEAATSTEDVIEGNNIVFVYTGFGTDVPGGVLVPDSKSYTVSFQSNGGSAVESQQIEEGRSASEPPVPSRDGYRFIGWYFNGEPYNFYLPITGDITLEAAWEEEHVLAAPSASFPSGSEVETGTKIVLTCAASGAEIYYTLDGTTPDRSSTLYREPIVVLGDTTIMAVAVKEGYKDSPVATFIYHAVNPAPDVCMVVFQSNGGTQIESQEIKAGETASRPVDPVREGYRFIGWYLDGELYDFASPVTGNIRLDAVWEEIGALDMPVSNIASGKAIPEGSRIILSTDQPGAKIYYTLDGTVPTDKALLYREPIVIMEDTVIMAVAVKKGWKDSSVATFRYTISVRKDDLGEILPEDFPEGGADAIPTGIWIAGVDEKGYTYTGKAIKPEVRVYDNKTLLQVKKDYTISYKNNIKAYDGTAGNKAPGIVVTGKGNYAGKETADFKILAKSIAAKDITMEDIVVNYNKRVQKAVPTLIWNGKKLRNKTDFTVEYPDLSSNADAYKVPGTYTVLVKGKGNYGGERKVSLLITESKLMSKVTVSKIAAQPYTGEEITVATMDKTPTVKSGRTVLRKDVHYTVSYEDNVEIGNAVMILTGTGKETPEGTYTGKKRVTFKITGGNIKKAAVTGIPKSMVYTGTAINEATPGWGSSIKLAVTGKNKEIKELTEGVDYTLEYQKNRDCGTAQIVFTGINGYSGTLKKSFKITAYDIQKDTDRLMRTVIEGQPVYAKGGCKPKPVVKFGNMLLEEGRDYTLSYKNNKAVTGSVSGNKIPTVTIKGKGNFKGSISLTYTIAEQDIRNLKLIVSDKVFQNRENAFKAVPKVIDLDGKVLKAGTDYEKYYNYCYGADTKLVNGSMRKKGDVISEYDILPVNTPIEMTITGKNNYTRALIGQYRITAADIAKAKVTIPAQTYSGSEITLDKSQLTVKIGQTILLPEDYEIEEDSYTNNVKKGNASVTIRGVGNYGGRKTVKFKIKAKSMLWWWR